MNLDEAKEYVQKVRWQYAKTYPRAPHEYTVLSWKPELQLEMIAFSQLIREQGRDEYFYKKKFRVLDIDEYKYWTMDEDVNDTDLINRTYNNYEIKNKIAKYVQSSDFIFRKEMSLSDIYKEIEND